MNNSYGLSKPIILPKHVAVVLNSQQSRRHTLAQQFAKRMAAQGIVVDVIDDEGVQHKDAASARSWRASISRRIQKNPPDIIFTQDVGSIPFQKIVPETMWVCGFDLPRLVAEPHAFITTQHWFNHNGGHPRTDHYTRGSRNLHLIPIENCKFDAALYAQACQEAARRNDHRPTMVLLLGEPFGGRYNIRSQIDHVKAYAEQHHIHLLITCSGRATAEERACQRTFYNGR